MLKNVINLGLHHADTQQTIQSHCILTLNLCCLLGVAELSMLSSAVRKAGFPTHSDIETTIAGLFLVQLWPCSHSLN